MGDNDSSETVQDPDIPRFVGGNDRVEPGSSLSFRGSTIDKDAAAKVDKGAPSKLNPIMEFMEKVKQGAQTWAKMVVPVPLAPHLHSKQQSVSSRPKST